jgi:hypothetical protein
VQRLAHQTTGIAPDDFGSVPEWSVPIVPWMLTDGITGANTAMVTPFGSNLEN